jgi:hypothetical protein
MEHEICLNMEKSQMWLLILWTSGEAYKYISIHSISNTKACGKTPTWKIIKNLGDSVYSYFFIYDERVKTPLLFFFKIGAGGGGDNKFNIFDQIFENFQKFDNFFKKLNIFTKFLIDLAYDFHFLSPITLFITYFCLL